MAQVTLIATGLFIALGNAAPTTEAPNSNETSQTFVNFTYGDDQTPVFLSTVTAGPLIGTKSSLECPEGFKATSCGIKNTQFDSRWNVWPSSDYKSCYGYNRYGADLYATCVPDLVIDEDIKHIITGPPSPGNYVKASCGEWKVTACASKKTDAFETFRQMWPIDNHTCQCYNAECYATCIRYNQVDTYVTSMDFDDSNLNQLGCYEEGYHALGCGVRFYRAGIVSGVANVGYWVQNDRCYVRNPGITGSHTYTLYTICGKFTQSVCDSVSNSDLEDEIDRATTLYISSFYVALFIAFFVQ